MGLLLPGYEPIFERDNRVKEFITEEERRATVVMTVAKDGTGDTDSIQEAIDLLDNENGGGTILIKEGLYSEDSLSITNVDLIKFQGVGAATKIRTGGTTFMTIPAPTNENRRIVIFENLKFETNVTSNTFYMTSGSAILMIKNCVVDMVQAGTPRKFINVSSCKSVFLDDCYFYDGNEIIIDSCDNSVLSNLIIEGGTIEIGNKNSLRNIYLTTQESYGINIAGDYNMVSGCYVDTADTACFRLENSSNYNTLSNCTALGSNSGAGFFIDDDNDRNIIMACISRGNATYGIRIDGSNADKNILVGNVVISNSSANISDAGTGTVNANNITS